MEKATKKKHLGELDDLNQIKKEEMGEFLGGNTKPGEKKRGRFLGLFFGPSPCQGDLPQ
ncbi:MAG: hypothetical protein H6577_23550 [Lewinellaceae bacterium]|nr:hypothetical protein [Saprospiraceae bacterium]MCB9341113.1 hypothetical protein [Lewinellaceae bacterium]